MRHFWVDEGTFPNILFTAAVTAGAGRPPGPADAPGAVRDRAGRLAGRADRGRIASVKRAVMNMVVHAYDLFFYLSSWSTISYLWSDQRRYLVGSRRRAAGRGGRGLARLPRRRHARAAPLGGAGPAPASWRSPGTAPTPRASAGTCSSTTRTCTSPPSMRPGARRSRRCGGARCWRRRRARPRPTPPSPFRRRATPAPSRRTSS